MSKLGFVAIIAIDPHHTAIFASEAVKNFPEFFPLSLFGCWYFTQPTGVSWVRDKNDDIANPTFSWRGSAEDGTETAESKESDHLT
jgi:hypothetical protein